MNNQINSMGVDKLLGAQMLDVGERVGAPALQVMCAITLDAHNRDVQEMGLEPRNSHKMGCL